MSGSVRECPGSNLALTGVAAAVCLPSCLSIAGPADVRRARVVMLRLLVGCVGWGVGGRSRVSLE